MGRFRFGDHHEEEYEDDDDDYDGNNSNNLFRAQHVYSEMMEDDDDSDERSGVWRGPIVPLMAHHPQEQETNFERTSPQHQSQQHNENYYYGGERAAGGSPIHPPSCSIRRRRRNQNSTENDNDDHHHGEGHDSIYDNHEIVYNNRNGAPAVFHIHYNSPPQAQPRFGFFAKFVIIFIGIGISQYGPAFPPPFADCDSWNDFFWKEATIVGTQAKRLSSVAKYVGEFTIQNMKDDAQYQYNQYTLQQKGKMMSSDLWSDCSIRIPTSEWDLEYTNSNDNDNDNDNDNIINNNLYKIVDQPAAIKLTTQSLDSWQLGSNPQFLYFLGGPGVGKMEMAKQLSLRMFGHCLDEKEYKVEQENEKEEEDEENSGGKSNIHENEEHKKMMKKKMEMLLEGSGGPVMILQGRDYPPIHEKEADDDGKKAKAKVSETAFRSLRIQLYENILKHVTKFPNGSVIVFRRIEGMEKELVVSLIQDLANPSLYTSTEDERAGIPTYDYEDPEQQQSIAFRLRQSCGKTVFIMTSFYEKGVKSMSTFQSEYGGGSAAKIALHDWDTKLLTILAEQFEQDLGNLLGLAPFTALDKGTMKQVLAQKARRWKVQQPNQQQQQSVGLPFSSSSSINFSMTQQALDELLDHVAIRWWHMQGKKKSSDDVFLKFTPQGGHELEDGSSIMKSWQSAVNTCLVVRGGGVVSEMEDENEDEHHQAIIRSSMDIVLDFDTKTLEGVLLQCPSNTVHYDPFGVALMVGMEGTECSEICRTDLGTRAQETLL